MTAELTTRTAVHPSSNPNIVILAGHWKLMDLAETREYTFFMTASESYDSQQAFDRSRRSLHRHYEFLSLLLELLSPVADAIP